MNIKGGILHNRNFLNLWSSQVFSQLALHSINFVLAITAYSITNANKSVAFVVMASGLAAFLFGIPAGVLSDHLNRKSTLFWTSIFRFLIVFSLVFVSGNLFGILILVFILGSVTQFFFPSEAASIPTLVKKKNLVSANSLFSITYYIAQIVGYMSAGFLLLKVGYQSSVLGISVSFLIAALFISQINYPKDGKNGVSNRSRAKSLINSLKNDFEKTVDLIREEILKGFKLIKSNTLIKTSFIYLVGLQITIGVTASLIPGFAVEVIGVDAEKSSFFLIPPIAIGLFFGSAFLSEFKNRINRKIAINVAIAFAFFGFFISSYIPGLELYFPEINKYAIVILSMFFIGIANAFVFVLSNTTLQENVPESLLGRVYGLLQTVVTVGGVLPVLFGGVIADIIGVHYVFMILSFFVLLLHLSVTFILYKK